jgi:hypothetical protein
MNFQDSSKAKPSIKVKNLSSHFYYLNDDCDVSSKIVIRRVKRLGKSSHKSRFNRFSLINEYIKEDQRVKVSKKRKNRNGSKRFFEMKIIKHEFTSDDMVFLCKKLNKNFSQRERLFKKYQQIFQASYERIKSLESTVHTKYINAFEFSEN